MSASAADLTALSDENGPRPFTDAREHMQAELEWLRLVLHREILRLKAANLLSSDPFRGLYLADEQVDAILSQWHSETGVPQGAALAEMTERAAMQRARIDAQIAAYAEADRLPPLLRLAQLFDLTPFECHVLVAALAVELDLRFEVLYSWARNDVTRKRPSVDLVLKLFCDSSEERFSARESLRRESPLFRNQLLRTSEDQQERDSSFLARALSIDERIAGFILDERGIDKRLAGFTSCSLPSRPFTSLHLPEGLVAQLQRAASLTEGVVLFLSGPEGAGKRSAVEALSTAAHRSLLSVDSRQLAASTIPPAILVSLLQREAMLCDADLLFENADALVLDHSGPDAAGVALERIEPAPGVRIFVAGDAPWPSLGSKQCGWYVFEFPVPCFLDRVQLWEDALNATAVPVGRTIDLELLANRFALTGGAIHRACADAVRSAIVRARPIAGLTTRDFEATARAQSSHGLCRFAQKTDRAAPWEALIVPPHILRQLRDICTAERYRHKVYFEWGFEQQLTAGKGLNVLFAGASGTGKTMAAGILARELGRDLYRVDLSIVVSKYIGETEKQLSLIFREAKSSNAMLFFDEADALFGKRSEVKDAHDRYANVEIAYLLQKMEEYEGIVILATNLRRNMDEAFSRRMHHVVEFPFPDAEHREKIWRSILPPAAPIAGDINFGFLARQFELAGGSIRNIALAAAFLAAEAGTPILMEHCIICTAMELQKSGKLPSRSEFRDYYDLIRSRV
jgi:AAA+ superfamily predicted ATPase